uniref:Integrase catalytic domain-containing protein n=2 Tax=Onchocerca ochengi TaxID=42157 RepID=A0A182EV55_ONCOC
MAGHWQKPDIIIGVDYFFKFIQFNKTHAMNSGFSLVNSIVGAMVAGSGYISKFRERDYKELFNSSDLIAYAGWSNKQSSNNTSNTNTENSNIQSENNEIVKPTKTTNPDIDRFWKLEIIGVQEDPNLHDDEHVLERLRESIKKVNDRYQVAWPWKETNFKLNDNLEQLQFNIIEKVSPEMDQVGIIHYLPHHEVVTPSKATTKIRIVYDASSHTRGMKSLNDVIHRGPITLPDLVGILLRFRMMKNVIVADIEKAYLQLELLPTERNCTRFLWLKDIRGQVTEDNVEHYRFQRVLFGVISSPFHLSATLNYHLKNHGSKLAREISKNLYVDNIKLSTKDTYEALANYKEMKTIFGDASMNIREFLSNDKEFNATIPKQDRAEEIQIKKILGIYWNPNPNVIQINAKPWKDDREPTKRTIFQFLASQYDSLGFLTPCILPIKLFLQSLWKKQIRWDQALKAYADAVYAKQEKKVSLIFAKSRIAPTKGTTVPRLELLAVLIGVRATQFVTRQMELEHSEVIV